MLKKAIEVVADRAQNRLHITIHGNLNRENLKRLYSEVRFCVADLRPGFDAITDLSHCSLAALRGVPTFRKITNYLVMNQVGRVVRVIDAKKIVLRHLIHFTTRINGCKTDLCCSLAEAETALSNQQRRDALRFVLLEQVVNFRVGEQEGTGLIHDLSTSGCAITTTDALPAVFDEVGISIGFKKYDEIMGSLECKAIVVWVNDQSFGIKFASVSDRQKEQLQERLNYESE